MRLERLTINFFLTFNTTITHVIVQYIRCNGKNSNNAITYVFMLVMF